MSHFNFISCHSQEKWLDLLSWLVIFSLVISLGLGLFVPLYTDEVATKFVQARFFAEDGKMLSLFPQCASGFILDTPISWYPAALIHSFLYSNLDPLGVRIVGVATAFIWLAVLSYWVILTIPARQGRLHLLAAIAAVLGLGVLPFTLVLARAEQWLVLLLTIYCLLPALAARAFCLEKRWGASVWLIIFCILTSLFNYTHPKAVFFLPVVFVSATYFFGARHWLLLGLALIFAVLCSYQSVQMANAVLRCEEAPMLSGIAASQTLKLAMITESPKMVLLEGIDNLASAPGKIIAHLTYQKDYQSGWLPTSGEGDLGFLVRLANFSIKTVLQVIYWIAVVIPPVFFWLGITRKSESYKKYLIAALWIALVGHLTIYRVWNFYGGSLAITLMVMLLALCSTFDLGFKGKCLLRKWSLATFSVVSLLSSVVLIFLVSPKIILLATSAVDILPGQPLSVKTFNFSVRREHVRSLAKVCDIKGDGARRLVVDDLTYFAFENLQQPLHLIYLYEGGFGADIGGENICSFLSGIGSDGIIAQCTYISPVFNKIVVREGSFCCVNLKKNLNMENILK
jgi:hypothetical protein